MFDSGPYIVNRKTSNDLTYIDLSSVKVNVCI